MKTALTDEALATRARESDDGTRIPATLVDAVLDGQNPVKLFREWRSMTQDDLAKECGLSKNFILMLETGRRILTDKTACKIAASLDIDADMLQR